MREIRTTSAFEKDAKRQRKRGKDLSKLKSVVSRLANGEALLPSERDHPLQGQYRYYRECHVEPDWLLIYSINDAPQSGGSGALNLIRTGTHSDLFDS